MARTKGSLNKLSATVKDNVISVFNRLGGVEKMVIWAEENQTDFYRLYAKLLPTEINVNEGETAIERILECLTDSDLTEALTGLRIVGIAAAKGSEKTVAEAQPDQVH